MGVVDGTPVDAATTNPAFVDQNADDVMHGILGMDNAVPASGAVIGNVQGALNHLKDTTGATEVSDGTTYASQKRITNGQNHQTALSNLDTAFHETTGHKHTGVAGDAPLIPAASLTGAPLIGSYSQGTDLTGITGVSTNVSVPLTGKTPSSGPTVAGVVVTAPNNRVLLLSSANATLEELIYDSSGRVVYGRLTEAAGVWTLSFYVLIAGVETAHNFTVGTAIRWFYQELFNKLTLSPVYSDQLALMFSRLVRSLTKTGEATSLYGDVEVEGGANVTITRTGQKFTFSAVAAANVVEPITNVNFAASPYAVTLADGVLLVDATGGAVVINLYQILGNIGYRVRVKKTDASANTVTVNAFAGDGIDQAASFVITQQDEAITIISSTLFWRVFA